MPALAPPTETFSNPRAAEARLRDPAHRDQDGATWRRGRFEERVRRQWNPVPGAVISQAGEDLAAMSAAIHGIVGGDLADILARLTELKGLDDGGGAPADDPLVRPGAPD